MLNRRSVALTLPAVALLVLAASCTRGSVEPTLLDRRPSLSASPAAPGDSAITNNNTTTLTTSNTEPPAPPADTTKRGGFGSGGG